MSETLLSCWEKTVRVAPEATAMVDVTAGRKVTRADLVADVDFEELCLRVGHHDEAQAVGRQPPALLSM